MSLVGKSSAAVSYHRSSSGNVSVHYFWREFPGEKFDSNLSFGTKEIGQLNCFQEAVSRVKIRSTW